MQLRGGSDSVAITSARAATTAAALMATLGLAAGSWVVAISPDEQDGHGRPDPTRFVRILRRCVGVDDGGHDAAGRRSGGLVTRSCQRSVRAVPLFVGSYLAVWTLVDVAVYGLYRPHGSTAAGGVAMAAGIYEFTPLKQHFRRGCNQSVGPGSEFGVYCVGSSID